jgi:hypothetical protein
MAELSKIKEIEERKRHLVLAGELNRQILAVEARNLAPVTERLERGFAYAQMISPYWTIASPVLTLLLARRRRVARPRRLLLGKAFLGLQLLRKGMRLWRMFRRL